MDLLDGYGSDSSASADGVAETDKLPAQGAAKAVAPSADDAGAGRPKRVKVHLSQLPIARPLPADIVAEVASGKAKADADEGDAPLRHAAQRDDLEGAARRSVGLSLLAALPPPKVTLGSTDTSFALGGACGSGGGGSRLNLGDLALPRRQRPTAPVADVLRFDGVPDEVEEDEDEVPEKFANHPMFSSGLVQDGPSQDDLHILRRQPKFINIKADDMKDPDWYMKNLVQGGPGLHKGKKVVEEVSLYESRQWKETTHADPSRVQKRKHQINWLAHDAMENEAEMLDRNASGRLTKSQTSMKYGW